MIVDSVGCVLATARQRRQVVLTAEIAALGGGGEDDTVESDCPDASFADLASPSSAS